MGGNDGKIFIRIPTRKKVNLNTIRLYVYWRYDPMLVTSIKIISYYIWFIEVILWNVETVALNDAKLFLV